jgi:hypothetical protein
MMKQAGITIALVVFLAGCASKSENIEPTYLSPQLYSDLSCSQLEAEAQRVSQRAQAAAGQQDKNRKNDIIKTTVGVVVFWPILFTNSGDGPVAAELANLKGQMKAIEATSRRKNCGIQFKNQS